MYTCDFCVILGGGTADKLSYPGRAEWRTHLLSKEHRDLQNKQNEKGEPFKCWDPKRTIVVERAGVEGKGDGEKVKISAERLLRYFTSSGDVQNFYIKEAGEGYLEDCRVLMSSVDDAKKIHEKGVHTVRDTTLRTSRVASNSAKNAQKSAILSEGDGNWHYCLSCDRYLVGDETWIRHLLSKIHRVAHQNNHNIMKTRWDLDKYVVVTRMKGLNPSYVLRYLIACGGMVDDFHYLATTDGFTDDCHALMSNKDAVEKLLAAEPHCVGPQRREIKISSVTPEKRIRWERLREDYITEHLKCQGDPGSGPHHSKKSNRKRKEDFEEDDYDNRRCDEKTRKMGDHDDRHYRRYYDCDANY